MPRTINLPGGDTATFPDGMSDEAIESVLREQYSDYSNEGRSRPTLVNPDAGDGAMGRYWAGVKGGAARLRDELLPPGNPLSPLGVGADNVPARKAALAQYEQTKDQLGTAGWLGDVTPEVALTAVPISRAGTAIARAPMLARTLGRLAPAAGDIVANSGYEAAKAAYKGDDVTSAALTGAAGAAGGRVLARTLTGAKTLASPAARTLIDRGVIPSPGQLFDGPVGSAARSIEDKLTSLPIVGDMLSYSRGRSVGRFGNEAINESLLPLTRERGAKAVGRVAGVGDDAIDAAQGKISQAYDLSLSGMHVSPEHVVDAITTTVNSLPSTPLLDAAQADKLKGFIQLRLAPHAGGDGLTGEAAKKLDAEIGYNARKFSRSPNPGDHSLGSAFYDLQSNWRAAMAKGASPDDADLLNAANAAYKNLLPAMKAADRASAQGGRFTPLQLKRAATSYDQAPTDLTKAGQDVLPGRIPDSGTAGRLLLSIAAGGGALYTGPGTAAATALGAAVFSPAGMRLFARGVEGLVPNGVYRRLQSLPDDQLFSYIGAMARNPETREATERVLGQVASQLGRINSETAP